MIATKNLAEVIKRRSINVAAMCSQTGLSAKAIYAFLVNTDVITKER